jgi:hypothetical protein
MATGTGIRTCTICGAEETVIPINPNAHQLDPNYFIIPPTCTTAGSGALVCLLNPAHSNPTQQIVLPVNPDAHDWNTAYTTIPATETTDGKKAITCKYNNSHTKDEEFSGEYAIGTAGLAYELINNTSYRVRKGTVTSGSVHIPAYWRGNSSNYADYKLVTEIGSENDSDGAFESTAITAVHIPASVTSIVNYAFSYCESLTSITVDPSNPNYASEGGILFNKAKTAIVIVPLGISGTVTIPAGVTEIGASAFLGCTGLTGITIPAGVTEIGVYAFARCSGLTGITIPAGVTPIGIYAFAMCSSLTGITIPAGVTSIDIFAFAGCTGLTSITVNTGNQHYASEGGILYNKAKTTLIQAPGAISGSYTIPAGVTSIGYGAFAMCTSLTEIIIPAGVTSIGDSAFLRCSSLTSITVDANNPYYASEGGILYNKAKTTLIQAPGAISGSYTIPSGVTEISGGAFLNCTGLTGITIPAGVTSIGDSAFIECTGLASVTFAGTIASSSFSYLSSFPGDLRDKFYATDSANGTPGTYTRPNGSSTTWTRQP